MADGLIWILPLLCSLSVMILNRGNEGDTMYDKISQIIAIIIPIITVVISIVATTKKTNSKIRDTQDQIKEVKNAVDKISKQLGTESVGDTSLSFQHNEIKSYINENSRKQIVALEKQGNTINEINIRSIKEKAIKEEREKHLSPEMLEIKKVSEAFQALEKQMEELKFQNDKLIAKIEAVTNEKNLAENQHKEMMDDLNNMSTEELLRFFSRDINDLNANNDQKCGGGRGR